MNRKGPQKHPKEMVQAAIAKFEGGARLSAIAREFGVTKSTVKYWLDNASKFVAEGQSKNVLGDRLRTRLTRESWDIIFASLKEIRRKIGDATIRDLVTVIGELFDRQAQFGALTSRAAVPGRVVEASEELRITVRKYLEKKGEAEPSKEGQGAGAVEPPKADAPPIDAEIVGGEEGGANGAT